MAPTTSPTPVHPSNHQSSRRFHHFLHQRLNSPRHPLRRPTPSRTGLSMARTVDDTLQPSVVLEGPAPSPVTPTSSESVVLGPGPSAISSSSSRPQEPSQLVDIPGNIAAAVVVLILVLGGLVGLVVGGETLRRRIRSTERRVLPRPSGCSGHQKSEPTKIATGLPLQRTPTSCEKFPYDEKTLTPLMRPPPALNRKRQRKLSDIWPICRLSRPMGNRQSCPEQVARGLQHPSPIAGLQTTWSEFSPVSLYVTPPRTVLTSIPEELEDCQSQRSLECVSVVPTPQTNEPKALPNMLLELSVAAERRGSKECQVVYKAETNDEDAKSLGSSAPDMTSDGGESSSRSSIGSLESLENGNDMESLKEEVFELRRAQTRSMQTNKGVLLSLSFETLDESQNPGKIHVECGPSRTPSVLGAEGSKDCVEGELSLAMFGENFSAVNLDEFPSPPSILPVIPSFVSGF